eukprot:6213531-Pleurochrysis_carterae.AAC.2
MERQSGTCAVGSGRRDDCECVTENAVAHVAECEIDGFALGVDGAKWQVSDDSAALCAAVNSSHTVGAWTSVG